MFCSNCGAKVDDSAKFCPVCGNKLDKSIKDNQIEKSNNETLIEKSTYESISNNQNLIENQENNKEAKANKFKDMFSGLKNKKEDQNSKLERPNPKSELRNNKPGESLEQRIEFEEEIPPAYYGYNPTDDRKSKDKRRKTTGEANYFNKIKKRTFESSGKENSLDRKTWASEDIKSKDLSNLPSVNNIPSEYVEARVASLLKKSTGDSYDEKSSPNNLAAHIRSHQDYDDDTYQNSNYQNNDNIKSISTSKESHGLSENYDQEVKNDVKAKKDQGFKFKPLYLLPILLLALAIAIGYHFMNGKAKSVEIDLSNYIDVTYSGDNASASPSAALNTSKLLDDFGSQIKYVNKKRKSDQYGSAANQFVEELANSTTFQFSKDSNLSNGEEITVVANVSDPSIADDYNVLFASTMKSVIVDGLSVDEDINPFDYIDVNFQGEDPDINLTTSLTEDAPEYMNDIEIVPSKTSGLKAGEEVNITINVNEEDVFNTYQVRLNPLDKTFTVPGEAKSKEDDKQSKDGYIDTVDDLSENLLNELKENAGKLIKDTFSERTFTQIKSVNYLGAITGTDANSDDLKNRVMLVYEIKANEDYEGLYKNEYSYYSFVEYQNVKNEKEDGKFYSQGPLTTDNEIFHKFFVADDYTYYEIPYYGFAFLEEVIARVNNSLSGLTIDDSIAVDQSDYLTKTDGVANEYQGGGSRLSLREDGTLKYQKENRVHQGKWEENGNEISLTIEGVNVDTPINATFEDETINISEQGEMESQTFNKMQSF